MRGVFRTGSKFLAVFSSFNARRFSATTKIPGIMYHFECEAFFGQNQNSWPFFPVQTRGVFVRTEIPGSFNQFECEAFFGQPKFLAIFTSSNARRFSARTKVFGGFSQLKCEAFFGQNGNSWRYFPAISRGVFRPGPKFPVGHTSWDARRFSVRTKNPWQYVPV